MTGRSAVLALGAGIGALITATPSLSQESQHPRGATLEEVIVTARRVEENSQTVPMTVLSVGSEKLQDTLVRSSWDLEKALPGLRVSNFPTDYTSTRLIRARGVQGVLTYLNDAPFNPHSNAGYFDVSGVQFLKGPQGTLFGVAVTSGAILFETRKPTNEFGGYVVAGVGGRNHRELQAVFNVPVIDERLLVRAGLQRYARRGYIHDIAADQWLNDRDSWNGRLSTTFRLDDRFENTTMVNYYASDTNGDTFIPSFYNPNRSSVPIPDPFFPGRTLGASPVAQAYGGVSTLPPPYANPSETDLWFARQRLLGNYAVVGSVDRGFASYLKQRQLNVVNTTTFDISESLTLKNIFGWERFKETPFKVSPLGAAPFPAGSNLQPAVLPDGTRPPVNGTAAQQQFTEELQLQGDLFGEKLTFVLGAFYFASFNEDTDIDLAISPLPSAATPGVRTLTASKSGRNPRSTVALYVQGTYDLSDLVEGLKFTAGYRRNWDKLKTQSIAYTPASVVAGAPVVILNRINSGSFKTPAYTLSLSYQSDPDTMFYVTNSKSYGIGAFNGGVGLPAELVAVKPESLSNYEGGVKWQFRRGATQGRINLAGFWSDYRNAQRGSALVYINTLTGAPQVTAGIINVQKVHLYGAELEATFIPTPSLEFHASAAYVRYGVDKFVTPDGRDITSSLKYLPDTARFKYYVSGTYHFPELADGSGRLSFTVDWSHTTSTISTPADPIVPEDSRPAYGNLDMALKWRDVLGRERLDLTLAVTNVLDNERTGGGRATFATLGLGGNTPAEPREWTLTARYEF